VKGKTIAIALPVLNAGKPLVAAVYSLVAQTFGDLDIQIILNGSNDETTTLAHELAATDARIRVLTLPRANLAAALNVALSSTRAEFVARMDSDDTCPKDRIELQRLHMDSDPSLGALGCAWEVVDAAGALVEVRRPPTSPGEARWRLLISNPFAHGSMMLRRSAVLAVGGYRESRTRSQDYDLWLRLSRQHGIAALPETLYRHTLRPGTPSDLPLEQARHAAEALLESWGLLRAATPSGNTSLTTAVAECLAGQATAATRLATIETALTTDGPTVQGMLAWFWSQSRLQPQRPQVHEVCRLSRLREVGTSLRERGIRGVWLYGAGRHTTWLLENSEHLGLSIEGIIDDHAAGQQRGPLTVMAPAAIEPPADVLVSSDWHEQEIWTSAAPLRQRGIRVWRIYQDLERQQRAAPRKETSLASLLGAPGAAHD